MNCMAPATVAGFVVGFTLSTFGAVQAQCIRQEIVDPLETRFGNAIHVDENWLILGAPDPLTILDGSGAAHLHRRIAERWVFAQTLTEGFPLDFFGGAVQLAGPWAFISSRVDDTDGRTLGSVSVYRREALRYNFHQLLAPPPEAFGSNFGSSISANDSLLVVGYNSGGGDLNGAAIVYRLEDDI